MRCGGYGILKKIILQGGERMKKLKPHQVNIISWVLFAVAVVVLICGYILKNTDVMFVGAYIALGMIVFRMLAYRCPHCGGPLGRGPITYCPHCGENIWK